MIFIKQDIYISNTYYYYRVMLRVAQVSLAGMGRLQTMVVYRALHLGRVASAIQIKMPSLSPTMEEGTIVKWMKVGR